MANNQEQTALHDLDLKLRDPSVSYVVLDLKAISSNEGQRHVRDILRSTVQVPYSGDERVKFYFTIQLPKEGLSSCTLEALKEFVSQKSDLHVCVADQHYEQDTAVSPVVNQQSLAILRAALLNSACQCVEIERSCTSARLTTINYLETDNPAALALAQNGKWWLHIHDKDELDPHIVLSLMAGAITEHGRVQRVTITEYGHFNALKVIFNHLEKSGDMGSIKDFSIKPYARWPMACQLLEEHLPKITCLTKVNLKQAFDIAGLPPERLAIAGFDFSGSAELMVQYHPFLEFIMERNKHIQEMKQQPENAMSENQLLSLVIGKLKANDIYSFSMAFFILQRHAGVLFGAAHSISIANKKKRRRIE